MDVTTISSYRSARTRADLALAPGEAPIAGGTWLMSEPQPSTTGFVDLTSMGWADIEVTADGLRIGATCTIATLLAFSRGERTGSLPGLPPSWTGLRIVPDAANALLASFKIWNTATVGGNVCRSFAAGAMVSLAVAFDGVAHVWCPDGSDRRLSVAELITGNGTNSLLPGEILRAIDLPAAALSSRAVLHKIALAELGRSGAVVTGRIDDDGAVTFGVTASVLVPVVLRYPAMPSVQDLRSDVLAASGYYTDPLGPEDWRRGVSATLAEQVRRELLAETSGGSEAPEASENSEAAGGAA